MYRPPPLRGRHSVLEGKKVLLIDNNQPTRDVRVSVLRSHGVEVEPAVDFSSARSLQRLHHYDWIFLDVRRHFPGEALQFYEQIKGVVRDNALPFSWGPQSTSRSTDPWKPPSRTIGTVSGVIP